ncbi:CTP synthase [Fluviispira vulneris]|uniref:CTP synthase n=1 Tax=Fluviispira vulneris TaxID=2763012 RepID=UPI0016480E1D|nr:CTP synthase [Fluviispira vulneris]
MQHHDSKSPKRFSQHPVKYIFVTGGVVSSIGKGLAAASIGALLETRGLRVSMTKMDPYINVDPGTMSPFQHGEVFVTDDGAETDLDLGHYQRFTKANLAKRNSFTSGQVYDTVINKERRGDYLGGTVQVIPHITDQIKANIVTASEGADVSIVEIGGTIGDIESLPFLEAIRQFRNDVGKENSIFIHVTLIPYIRAAGELKTKPTQHSVKELRSIGIQPDILICRADQPMSQDVRMKISTFCNLPKESVFEALDADSIYKMPIIYHEQRMDARIVELLGIWTAQPNLSEWNRIIECIERPKHSLKIGVVGKYMGTRDSYKSVYEALTHAGIANEAHVEIIGIDSEQLSVANTKEILSEYDAILVPGGFGDRGVLGKMAAIQFARENNIPFFGICLGMQLACLEYARNVLGIADATSEEFDTNARNKIIHLMESQQSVDKKGGSMRLGAYDCIVRRGSKGFQAYGNDRISERHRHRYEFNPEFRSRFEASGFIVSGESPDGTLVEMMELNNHPWFLGCQAHPELKSRPIAPHPLFKDFVAAALERSIHK